MGLPRRARLCITDRGVRVLGELSGVIHHRVQPGKIHAHGVVIQVAEVAVEFARLAGGGERIGLVLSGVNQDQVPVGCNDLSGGSTAARYSSRPTRAVGCCRGASRLATEKDASRVISPARRPRARRK
jgi:hypothetical protein